MAAAGAMRLVKAHGSTKVTAIGDLKKLFYP
jgi:hypothetical protein